MLRMLCPKVPNACEVVSGMSWEGTSFSLQFWQMLRVTWSFVVKKRLDQLLPLLGTVKCDVITGISSSFVNNKDITMSTMTWLSLVVVHAKTFVTTKRGNCDLMFSSVVLKPPVYSLNLSHNSWGDWVTNPKGICLGHRSRNGQGKTSSSHIPITEKRFGNATRSEVLLTKFQGIWIADETLSQVFYRSSQSKQKLTKGGFPLSRFCLRTLTYVKIENVRKSRILHV